MFRFIHTSDIHLDASFSGAGFPRRLGDRKREAIRGTFRRIIEDACRDNVDLIVIPGDLFESENCTPDTLEFVRQQFAKAHPIRIFIAPGNHDPFMTGSPFKEEAWPENVHLFDREEFRSVKLADLGVRVTGFGFERPLVEDRIFRKLEVQADDCFNIVMAHGSDLSRVPAGKSKYGPFAVEEIAGKNVQYCALGHYHQQRRIPNAIDNTEIWYPGIPEGRGWDESGPRGYLFGEFTDDVLRIENRPCGQYILNTLVVDCDSFTTREQILDAILDQREAFLDSGTILRIRLEGALDPALDLSIAELDERLAEESLYIQWDDRTYPAWDFESIAREQTLRGRFVQAMNNRIDALPDGETAVSEERIRLERARLYGVQALSRYEVRLR